MIIPQRFLENPKPQWPPSDSYFTEQLHVDLEAIQETLSYVKEHQVEVKTLIGDLKRKQEEAKLQEEQKKIYDSLSPEEKKQFDALLKPAKEL